MNHRTRSPHGWSNENGGEYANARKSATTRETDMDPNATFIDLMNAIACADIDEALSATEALVEWIDHNGFPPRALKQWLAEPSEEEPEWWLTQRVGGKDVIVHTGDMVQDFRGEWGTFLYMTEPPTASTSGKVRVITRDGNDVYHYLGVWGLTAWRNGEMFGEHVVNVLPEIEEQVAVEAQGPTVSIHFVGPDNEEWMMGGCRDFTVDDGVVKFMRDGKQHVMPLDRTMYWSFSSSKEDK